MMGMELRILTLVKPLLEDSRLVPVQEIVATLQTVVLLDRQAVQRKDTEALPKMLALRTEVVLGEIRCCRGWCSLHTSS